MPRSRRQRESQAEYHRSWYLANRQKVLARARVQNKENTARARAYVRQAKSGPCVDCGGRFHFAAMQFDHVRGTKRFNIGDAIGSGRSIEQIRTELTKCELVCGNCHAVRTYEREMAHQESIDADDLGQLPFT